MTDADALRRAVLDRPDDDTPRLAFADCLDEAGDADRAAFVRLQVAAARAEPFGPAARAATAAADRLLAAHLEEWTRHLPAAALDPVFTRGFVGGVTLDAVRFPAVAPAVFAAEPVRAARLLRVPVPGEDPSLVPALTAPELARAARLELPALGLSLYADEWDALTTSPHLAGLRELSLRGTPVNPLWLTDLLSGPALPGLTALDLGHVTNVGPAVARGLAAAGHRRLAALDLTGVVFRLSDDLRQALAAKCLAGVEELRLGHLGGPRRPGPLTQLNLGWVLPWGALRVLDVGGHGVGPEGVKELARAPEARTLRWLGLRDNGFGPVGAEELVRSPHLDLYYLDVRGNGLRERDLAALRERFPAAMVEADPPHRAIRGR